jgi:GntR family transcriptional regulator, transcriptional repressor for pyruvate dehydrogenase complex
MSSTARASAAHSFSSSNPPPDSGKGEPAAASGEAAGQSAPGWLGRRGRRAPKASILLANDLRARILGEGMQPGTELPSEVELTRESGLGRATVREALRLLESEGLIAIRRGVQGGIEVTRPNLSQLSHSLAPILTLSEAPLADLIAFRMIVEPAVARLAAEQADEDQRTRLVELAEHGPGGGYENEVAFHVLLAECAGNELVRVLLVVPHDLLRLHLGGEDITGEDVREANRAHHRISHAVAAGEGADAARAMRRHLESFRDRMERLGRLQQPIVPRERWLKDRSLLSEILQGEWWE